MISILTPVVLASLLMLIAIFGASWALVIKGRRGDRRAPFTEDILRRPGEFVEKQLNESLDDAITFGLGFGMTTFAMASLAIHSANLSMTVLCFATWILIGGGCVWRLYASLAKAKNYRLGLLGERAVAQNLDLLMLDGARVFHDIELSKGNVDHIVVGNDMIFAVETKAVSKPALKAGENATQVNQKNASVEWTGKTLVFPHFDSDTAITQARKNARYVHFALKRATGKSIRVQPVVALPGWFVKSDSTAKHDVLVVNPKNLTSLRRGLRGSQKRTPDLESALKEIESAARNINAKQLPWNPGARETHDLLLRKRDAPKPLGN